LSGTGENSTTVVRDYTTWNFLIAELIDSIVHPGIEATDLLHTVHGVEVYKPEGYPDDQKGGFEPYDSEKVLCHNCGWKIDNERDAYTSRFKVMYTKGVDSSAIWELGGGGPWLMKDYPNRPKVPFVKDYMVRKLLREKKPSVPVPESHKFEGPDNKFSFEIMARAKGVPISAVYKKLSEQQRHDLFKDLGEHMKEWRQITSPRMGGVDGSELLDGLIGNCNSHGCLKTGSNEEEWLENLTPGIRKGLLCSKYFEGRGWTKDNETLDLWVKETDEQLAELKANFPRGGPYVLTHCDLHYDNIFASDDNEEKKWKVSAIIDWELAGFYPWWVESFKAMIEKENFLTEIESENLMKLWTPVSDVISMWENGGAEAMCKHGSADQANIWLRKPFCACQPYAGDFRDDMLGWEDQEHLDVFDVDSELEDSEYDEEADREKKFRKVDRAFQRWFNEISSRS
jgi:hypothetical protein